MRSFIFSLFLCLIFFTPEAFAGSYALETNPTYPQPDESYTVTLSSIGNTNNAQITWFINGSVYAEGANKHEITVTPPIGDGGWTTIVARITDTHGGNTDIQKEIRPVRVDMHVSADTYTPAFYKGRPLPSSGSTVTATALVFDRDRNSTDSYTYRWRLNGKALRGGVALAQNSVSFVPEFEDEVSLQVEVINAEGSVIALARQRVPIVEPELHFYEKNPLRGLSLLSLPDPFTLIAEETVIRGEPYYVDMSQPKNLHMEWELNGKKAENAGARNEISLQRTGDAGSAFVTFHIRNLTQLLQGVKESFTVQF